MESFKAIAPFYDLLMQEVPYQMWVNYYHMLLEHHHLQPRTLLDVCCGTGTAAELFAKQGFEVAGIDLSQSMISEAKRKAKEVHLDIDFYALNAASFELDKTFDGAYSFFDSLNYIVEPEDLFHTFQQVRKHLVPGGSFIFDLNTAYAFETNLFDQSDLDPDAEVQYLWKGKYDHQTRIIKVKMEFWYHGKRFLEEHVERAHPEEEVRGLLKKAGFQRVSVYDSYTLDPPGKQSDRVHYVAILEDLE